MREIKFKFLLEHKESKERAITRSFTLEELINCYGEETILESHHCDCQPVGETNVVDCNCDDYYSGFVIINRIQTTGTFDNKGNEVFDGDVLKGLNGNGYIKWIQKDCSFMAIKIDKEKHHFVMVGDKPLISTEIIGNVYKNPELLK